MLDDQARADRARHHLTEGVRELNGLVALAVGHPGVRARLREPVRAVEGVGKVEDRRLDGREHREEGVDLDQRECSPGTQHPRDAAHPRVEVVDPGEHPDRRVDEIRGGVEGGGQVAGVGEDGRHRYPAALR